MPNMPSCRKGRCESVRDYIPKTAVDPARIAGMSEIISDAVQLKFMAAPLTAAQIKDLVQMPSP